MKSTTPYRYYWTLLPLLIGALLIQPHAMAALPDFTGLVEQNSPAVVNISTTQKVQQQRSPRPRLEIPDFPEGTPWGDLFRHFFGDEEGIEEFDAQSLGSGFIIDAEGFVLTNYHVVRDADEIIVRLNDRRELVAELVGHDERSDIALLRIEADNLPVVKVGRSSDLKVGEWVLAIGSPFGFEHSVSVGVVSAIGRSLPRETYVPFIQTDVAINPGNSGGPLFNLDGEVVGINSQIYSRTGGFMGLSFAIPVDIAMDVVAQLKATGEVKRGWLGVLVQDVTRELAESFGMEKPVGALVAQVLPDSPAEQAGFQVGDVITSFNGREIVYSADLPPQVGRATIGEESRVRVVRDGKPVELRVRIAELPEREEIASRAPSSGPAVTSDRRLGLAITELTAEQREQLKLPEGGVLVSQVNSGPAADAGIRRGDVIVMLNNVNVRDVAHFRQITRDLPTGRSVPVLVQRGAGPIFLAIRVPGDK